METTTEEQVTTAPAPEEEAPVVPEKSPALGQAVQSMFAYSEFIHVGAGAATCEERETGTCADPLHFHAWIRLPNVIQKASIREKAQAAKARRARQLRDPETDAYAILEDEMEETRRAAEATEANKELLVDGLLMKTFRRDHARVIAEMQEEEEWSTFNEDKLRYDHLLSLPEEERDADEFEELDRHLKAYVDEVKRRVDKAQEPERQALMARDIEGLIEMARDARISEIGMMVFDETWMAWQMLVMTLKPRPIEQGPPVERVFKDMAQLQSAAPEVITALEEGFDRLERAMSAGMSAGN
jgi:hypothetical protein